MPHRAQKISCFPKNRTEMQIFRKKWKIGVPFGKIGKRLCPNNTVLQRANLCCGAEPSFLISSKTTDLYYMEQALENFRKGKGIFQIFLV